MSTKNRVHDGLFRVKLLFGSILLGGFFGVLLYLHWLNGWNGMTLIELGRGFKYVYSREPDALGIAAFGGAFTLGYLAWLFAWRPGSARPGDAGTDADNLRGQSLVTVAAVKKMLKRVETRLEIGGVPIPIAVEDRGFLLAGSQGTGKSQAITRMLDRLQADGHRAVIADPSGIFFSRYAAAGAVLLNPYDRRSVSWSPLADIQSAEECAAMARSIVPDGVGDGAEWSGYAQTLLEAVLEHCWRAGGTTGDVLRLATFATPDELREVLPVGPVSALISPDAAKMLGSVRAILGSRLKPFAALDPSAGRDAFSIRSFITNENGWLFITYKQSQRDALRPLLAASIDVASRAVLDLPPASGDRSAVKRTWFVLDEMPLLGRITSLVTLLTNGSKHGAAVIAGLQTVAQLSDAYGRDQAQTVLATLGTWLTLRVSDAETADYMSRAIGDEEIRRVIKSGGKTDSGKSDNWSEQHSTRRVVMPSQLQNLRDLHGFLNISGDLPACAVTLPVAEHRAAAAPGFEPAPLRATPTPAPAQADTDTADTDLPTPDDAGFTLS